MVLLIEEINSWQFDIKKSKNVVLSAYSFIKILNPYNLHDLATIAFIHDIEYSFCINLSTLQLCQLLQQLPSPIAKDVRDYVGFMKHKV